MTVSYTRAVAEFVSGFSADDLPPTVADHTRSCVVDTIGCAVLGSTLPWGRRLIDTVSSFAGSGSGQVLGTDIRLAPDVAALVNGSLVHSFEMDDLHIQAFLHPGSTVFPAVLAGVQWMDREVSGHEMLTATALGYEVAIRVGLMAGLGLLRKGWHNTPAVGSFGAAVAVGWLLKLDDEAMNWAIGTAATQAGGLVSAQYGAHVKRLHSGRASQSGYYAAVLAAAGYTGIADVFDVEYGGYPSTLTDSYDKGELLEELGSKWHLEDTSFKLYPTSASCHTSIEAAMHFRNAMQVPPNDIRSITVHCSSATKEHVGWDYLPDTVTTAQMNLKYCMAVCLLDGSLKMERFSESMLSDEDAIQMTRRVTTVADSQIDEGGRVRRHAIRAELTTVDGTVHSIEIESAKGSPSSPVSEDEMKRKFTENVSSVYGERSSSLLDAVSSLDCTSDVSGYLTDALRIPARST